MPAAIRAEIALAGIDLAAAGDLLDAKRIGLEADAARRDAVIGGGRGVKGALLGADTCGKQEDNDKENRFKLHALPLMKRFTLHPPQGKDS